MIYENKIMNIYRRVCFVIILLFICCVYTGSCEYKVTFGDDDNTNFQAKGGEGSLPLWDIPLEAKIAYLSALIAGFFALIKFYPPFAGRIKSVLDNKKRKKIFEYISENPGSSVEEIGSEMDINRDSLRYHIKRLKQCNYVVIENTDNSQRVFPNHSTFTGIERKIISMSHNSMQMKIIALITKYPGIRNSDLKDELKISKSAVSWHIGRLENAGLLSCRRSGKARHYYIRSGLERVIVESLPEEIREGYGFSSEDPLDIK